MVDCFLDYSRGVGSAFHGRVFHKSVLGIGGTVVRANSFHLWVRGLDSRYGLMWKESVNALSKVVGFLRVLRFPPTGKVDRVG
jgi:hypothetical protein